MHLFIYTTTIKRPFWLLSRDEYSRTNANEFGCNNRTTKKWMLAFCSFFAINFKAKIFSELWKSESFVKLMASNSNMRKAPNSLDQDRKRSIQSVCFLWIHSISFKPFTERICCMRQNISYIYTFPVEMHTIFSCNSQRCIDGSHEFISIIKKRNKSEVTLAKLAKLSFFFSEMHMPKLRSTILVSKKRYFACSKSSGSSSSAQFRWIPYSKSGFPFRSNSFPGHAVSAFACFSFELPLCIL